MKTNQDYKNAALNALRGNWAPAILAMVVFTLIEIVFLSPSLYYQFTLQDTISSLDPSVMAGMMDVYRKIMGASSLTSLASVFLLYPLLIGFTNTFRYLFVKGDNRLTENMFSITFKRYWHNVWGYLLMYIFIALWSLLFIIPGIVKVFSYAMTPYILEENPELSANDAIDRSRAMMKGHKFDLFYLYLSFIGWVSFAFSPSASASSGSVRTCIPPRPLSTRTSRANTTDSKGGMLFVPIHETNLYGL